MRAINAVRLLLFFLIITLHQTSDQVMASEQKISPLTQEKIEVFNKKSIQSKIYAPLFFHAIALNAYRMIVHFLRNGFCLETRSPFWFDQTPLHHALDYGNEQTALFLIKHRAPLHLKDRRGNTPLHLAARRGFLKTCTLLVETNGDVDERDEFGYTPLHEAVEQGQVEVAHLLLMAQADVNTQTCNGDTALHLALVSYAHNPSNQLLKKKLKKVIKLLGQHKPDLTKQEIYNRWNVFNLLNNLELPNNEHKKLLALLNEIKES